MTYETRSIGHCRCELSDGDIRNEVRHGITNSEDYQDQPVVTGVDRVWILGSRGRTGKTDNGITQSHQFTNRLIYQFNSSFPQLRTVLRGGTSDPGSTREGPTCKTLTTSSAIAAIQTILHVNPAKVRTNLHVLLVPSVPKWSEAMAAMSPATKHASVIHGPESRSPLG